MAPIPTQQSAANGRGAEAPASGSVTRSIMAASAIMMVLSKEIIAVLFQHGRFTAASTAATAPVLAMYSLGAFGLAATNMVSRGFYAVQNTVLPMVVSSLAAICSLPLYWAFLRLNGAPGIALVGSLFMLVQFVVLAGLWTRRYQGQERRLSSHFGKSNEGTERHTARRGRCEAQESY